MFSKKKKALEENANEASKADSEAINKGQNPYLNAKTEWLERYGTYIKQAHNWRIFSFFVLLICMTSICMNFVQISQQKVVPYIIEVDKLGHSQVIASAEALQTAPEHFVQSTIATCITNWRTVTADIELQKKMIANLSFFFTGMAKGVLTDWYKTNNPYEIAQEGKLVHVEVKSLPLPISRNSYRVEWEETVRNHTGAELEKQRYEATVTVQIQQPTNVDIVLNNPAGIYITAISATKILL